MCRVCVLSEVQIAHQEQKWGPKKREQRMYRACALSVCTANECNKHFYMRSMRPLKCRQRYLCVGTPGAMFMYWQTRVSRSVFITKDIRLTGFFVSALRRFVLAIKNCFLQILSVAADLQGEMLRIISLSIDHVC